MNLTGKYETSYRYVNRLGLRCETWRCGVINMHRFGRSWVSRKGFSEVFRLTLFPRPELPMHSVQFSRWIAVMKQQEMLQFDIHADKFVLN